jgi:hypothetical protein
MSVFDELSGEISMSPLDDQSNQLHEVFLSLRKAGFTEKQALYIVSMSVVAFDTYIDEDIDEEEEELIIYASKDPSDLQEITPEEPSSPEEDSEDSDSEES